MTDPETRSANAGGLRIPCQKWGSGPPCLIVPALVLNVEIAWEHELFRRTLERMYRRQIRLPVEDGDAPIATTQETVDRFLQIAETWGEAAAFQINYELPSQNGNEGVSRWMARPRRFSASPNDFRKQLQSIVTPERIRHPLRSCTC